MSDRPSDRPDRHPVFVYGGPSTITKGIKDVPAWYAKYQPQQQQKQQPPSDSIPSASTNTNTNTTFEDQSFNRPRHASTGSIDSPLSESPESPASATGGGSVFRRSSSSTGSSSGGIFPSLRPDPSPTQTQTQGRRESMGSGQGGRLFSGLTSQKRESHKDEDEWKGRRESWGEQRMRLGGGGGMGRLMGNWWDGVTRGEK